MTYYSPSIEKLIESFEKLPSIGNKTAIRLAFHILNSSEEEANEFIERFKENDNLPMITSCSPGWVKYIEMNYPELLPHLSTCKSPHQMFGALLKTYYAEKEEIDQSKIYVVSVMPCIAKKFERQRKEMTNEGMYDVDNVITTRELARMIKQAHIDFVSLEDSQFDDTMGEATGAAAIFGVTGGVMEAALRTVKEILEWVYCIVIAVVLALLVRYFVGTPTTYIWHFISNIIRK